MAWSMAKVSNFFALQYPGTNLLGKKSKRLVSLPLDCRPHIISINSNFLIMTWLTFCIICKCSYTYQKTNILQNLCYQQPILLSREFILPNPIIYWIRFKANSLTWVYFCAVVYKQVLCSSTTLWAARGHQNNLIFTCPFLQQEPWCHNLKNYGASPQIWV